MSKELMQVIKDQEDRFLALDEANGGILNFKQECLFARQQITRNSYTQDIAARNPNSLQASILNVAAIGISLNPAMQHAFLVPRGDQICLDISFRGLTKIATDSGSIKWAKAELVYSEDKFKYKGVNQVPDFEANVFGDRGNLIGGYCLAKLPDGEYLVDTMTIEEIHKVRESSKAKNNGPWVDWYEEMCKKTLIKRAYKSWPQTENRLRLDKAVETLNESEGTAYTIEEQATLTKLLDKNDAVGTAIFCECLDSDTYSALYYSFPKGKKTAYQKKLRELRSSGYNTLRDEVLISIVEQIDESSLYGVNEILEGYGESGANILLRLLEKSYPAQYECLSVMREEADE